MRSLRLMRILGAGLAGASGDVSDLRRLPLGRQLEVPGELPEERR